MTHKAEVRATLLPGQKGTVRLHKEYGDQLICVRYRYDKLRGRRLVGCRPKGLAAGNGQGLVLGLERRLVDEELGF